MSTDAATLRLAAVPKRGLLVDATLIAGGTGLIALFAQISFKIPGTPVPITGQTFAVVLVGASLGAVLGIASTVLYLLVGVAGAPIYADGGHGWAQITGASGGYIIGFIAAAALTGFLAEHRWDRRFSSSLSAMLCGNVIIYLIGLPWLAAVLNTDFNKTLELGLYPFIAGDVVKLYLAGAALPGAWWLVKRLRD